jgi:23S rRNA pseudouridine1911/1915/1917 synthase
MVGDNICADPARKMQENETIALFLPPPVDDTPEPENIPLDIIFEDGHLLIINKQAGLVVHPGAGNRTGTLVNALLYHCGDDLSGIGGVRRPGIVHRLDKETTGLMVIAKTDKAHQGLSEQLAGRLVKRHYKALVWHVPALRKGRVDEPIGRHKTQRVKMAVNPGDGRAAATNYEILERYGEAAALLECRLESGRTHQVRVHMSHIGHPLIGDPLYGIQKNGAQAALKKAACPEEISEQILSFNRQALHAFKISFTHPVTGEKTAFEAPLPEDMDKLTGLLRIIPV